MRFEVEAITEELLPAVRSILASNLKEDYGLKQTTIAEKLGVTQPAVSQYLSQARADQGVVERLKGDPQIAMLLDDAASKAAKDQDFSPEIAQVVQTVRDKGLMKEEFEDTKNIT